MQRLGGGSPLTGLGMAIAASAKDGRETPPVLSLRVAGADVGYSTAKDVAFVRLEPCYWPLRTEDSFGRERGSRGLPRNLRRALGT